MRDRRSKNGLVLVMIRGKGLNWTMSLALIFSLIFTLSRSHQRGFMGWVLIYATKPLVTVLYDLHEYERDHDLA